MRLSNIRICDEAAKAALSSLHTLLYILNFTQGNSKFTKYIICPTCMAILATVISGSFNLRQNKHSYVFKKLITRNRTRTRNSFLSSLRINIRFIVMKKIKSIKNYLKYIFNGLSRELKTSLLKKYLEHFSGLFLVWSLSLCPLPLSFLPSLSSLLGHTGFRNKVLLNLTCFESSNFLFIAIL